MPVSLYGYPRREVTAYCRRLDLLLMCAMLRRLAILLVAAIARPERSGWAAGIEFYAPYSKRSFFDDELVAIKEALRTAEGRTSLEGLPIDTA